MQNRPLAQLWHSASALWSGAPLRGPLPRLQHSDRMSSARSSGSGFALWWLRTVPLSTDCTPMISRLSPRLALPSTKESICEASPQASSTTFIGRPRTYKSGYVARWLPCDTKLSLTLSRVENSCRPCGRGIRPCMSDAVDNGLLSGSRLRRSHRPSDECR